MGNDSINVRVLQQDIQDEIRIGRNTTIQSTDIEKFVGNVKLSYEKRLEWCGGFKTGCKKYYQRIAVVDGNTLHSIKEIYPGEEAQA